MLSNQRVYASTKIKIHVFALLFSLSFIHNYVPKYGKTVFN